MTKKSGLADSPFFAPQPKVEVPTSPPATEPVQKTEPEKKERLNIKKTVQPSNRDTIPPRNHDTTVSRYQDTTTPRMYGVAIELVRKAVKENGKEAATHRFTVAEKREVSDLIYTYKNRNIKTSENEITRIAVNFIIEDHKENGENSVLHKILEALNE